MIKYTRLQEIIDLANEKNCRISDIVIADQANALEMNETEVKSMMYQNHELMMASISSGMNSDKKSFSGLSGGDAKKMNQYRTAKETLTGKVVSESLAAALAVSEVNACMGRIVAAPTAGSCGILPACLYSVKRNFDVTEDQIIASMFTASAIGMVISTVATVSGAQGGCQAECGSATAMAAGAIVELMGGSPDMVGHACALAIKSMLGLVCDPVAGLVEVPCVKRNAMGSSQAFTAADLALAGITSFIPIDEVIGAMKSVGDEIPSSLKETAEGGLADTKTARAVEESMKNCK